MPSETEIANLALGHLGVIKEIQDLDTESSAAAIICRRFFDQSRDETLRNFPWPFTRKFSSLSLVEENPTDEWTYSYRYPADCIRFTRILSGQRNDNQDTRVRFIMLSDDTGRLIYTDEQTAVAEYHKPITETGKWTPDFVQALALLLASHISPTLTRGDAFKLREKALQKYLFMVNMAKENALHEEQFDRPSEAETIRGRE